ncbi:type II toxin-antitoxin system PemK/MazF family toxin [Agromyces atrinae]|uniref:Type II toxin-antitoxin system PemK/MazF family toxin n=2 Tax=Agromyces atrinae TaxID=592376 RepID=A0A852SEG6_9MICO|nr:type II toxin-antitoxin system PemK/MazF family toxin [Agromyces atrinae]NYD65865.1 hypothetical protein [Agromyces atrinae]
MRFLTALRRLLPARRTPAAPTRAGSAGSAMSTDATVEVDPRRLGRVRLSYAPQRDSEPDPGEIVWTWVPFEENDGRGKDRPVVVVAAGADGSHLAVRLTSHPRAGDPDYLSIGRGDWDSQGRESWVDLGRVFRVSAGGVRREASALDSARYTRVAAALSKRYGWR